MDLKNIDFFDRLNVKLGDCDLNDLSHLHEIKSYFEDRIECIQAALDSLDVCVPSEPTSHKLGICDSSELSDQLAQASCQCCLDDLTNHSSDPLSTGCAALNVHYFNKFCSRASWLFYQVEVHSDAKHAAMATLTELVRKSKIASSCCHLSQLLEEHHARAFNLLKQKYSTRLNALLTECKFPHTIDESSAGNHSQTKFCINTDTRDSLHITVEDLCRLDLCQLSQTTISLPTQLIAHNFSVRFRYHFCSNHSRTNRHDKPEWYISLVMQWFLDNYCFFSDYIQPIFDEHLTDRQAVTEFCLYLTRLVANKLHTALLHTSGQSESQSPAVVSHIIDEALRMRTQLAHLEQLEAQECIVRVLCLPRHLNMWLQLEFKYALLKIDQLLVANDGWHTRHTTSHENCGNTEDLSTDICEGFIEILTAIANRFSFIKNEHVLLRFLDNHLNLIDHFRISILQVLRDEKHDPLSEIYLGVLNSVNRLKSTFQIWSEDPFFLCLQYFKLKIDKQSSIFTNNVTDYNERWDEDSTDCYLKWPQDVHQSLLASDMDGTVFDSCIDLLSRIEVDLCETISTNILSECKLVLPIYCNDAWHTDFNPEYIVSTLSLTACPLFQCIHSNIFRMEKVRAAMKSRVMCGVSSGLDELLFNGLIMENTFSACGVKRLSHEVCQCLCRSAGVTLPRVVEAVSLLSLPVADALCVRNLAQEEMRPAGGSISHLTLHQVLDVLSRRSDFALLN